MKFSDYKEESSDGQFWNIDKGENRVRILSETAKFKQHWDKNKGSVVCINETDQCKYCEQGDSPSSRYLFWVYVREKDLVALVEAPQTVFEGIGTLSNSDSWGYEGIPPYDIVIKKQGEGLDTKYAVMPSKNNDELSEKVKKRYERTKTPPEEIVEKKKEKAKEAMSKESSSQDKANEEAQLAAQQDSPGKAPQGQAENVPVDA